MIFLGPRKLTRLSLLTASRTSSTRPTVAHRSSRIRNPSQLPSTGHISPSFRISFLMRGRLPLPLTLNSMTALNASSGYDGKRQYRGSVLSPHAFLYAFRHSSGSESSPPKSNIAPAVPCGLPHLAMPSTSLMTLYHFLSSWVYGPLNGLSSQ